MKKTKNNKKLYKLLSYVLILSLVFTTTFPSIAFAEDGIKTYSNIIYELDEKLTEYEQNSLLKLKEYQSEASENNSSSYESITLSPTFVFDDSEINESELIEYI